MLRLFYLLLAATFTINSMAQTPSLESARVLAQSNQERGQEEAPVEPEKYSELEYQLIESAGLMSLSQQVKYSAQQFIQQSNEAGNKAINHAQHFAIAKNLAKRWTEIQWQQRLLVLIDEIPVATQQKIQQQLAHPLIQSAQRKEKQAIAVQHSSEYQLYINKLRQNRPAASRWQLIEHLDKSSGFSNMLIHTRAAVIAEVGRQAKGWKAPANWQANTRQEVLDFLFYAYRKTPNTELKRIAEQFNKPELNQFYGLVRSAI